MVSEREIESDHMFNQMLLTDAEKAFVDYMMRNNLGNPEKQHNVKWGRKWLSDLKMEGRDG